MPQLTKIELILLGKVDLVIDLQPPIVANDQRLTARLLSGYIKLEKSKELYPCESGLTLSIPD
jgi:hypothetical protein